MTTSAQLERETEKTRAEIVGALAELRERLTPGRIVDDAFDFARDGRAGQFIRNLGRQAAENPMPVILAGASLAWLMMGRHSAHADGRSRARSAVSDAVATVADVSHDTASGMAARARSAAESLTRGAESAASNLAGRADVAGAAIGEATSAAAGNVAGLYESTGESARHAAGNLASFLKEEPIVLAGIGLALGAVLGAAFPATEMESRLMSETSDAVKEGAEQGRKKGDPIAGTAADKDWEEANYEAQAHGVMSG